MQEKRVYTIGISKLRQAYMQGFKLSGDGALLVCQSHSRDSRHFIVLNRFRSYKEGTKWGRFHCKAQLAAGQSLSIWALSEDLKPEEAREQNEFFKNPQKSYKEKKERFQKGKQFINHTDMLLYELSGEYLWLFLEVEGAGGGMIFDMLLDSQGDNFMQTFPEIYQEEGSFFHRYLSVFSSVYQDMETEIAGLDRYLDVDTAPVPTLRKLAGWMGYDFEEGVVDERTLRGLVRELYRLNRIKGTKEGLQLLLRTVLGEEAVIVERSRLNEDFIPEGSRQIYRRLYGDDPQDVTVLVDRRKDERLKAQLLFLLNLFKPVRSRIRLVFLQGCNRLDSYCYLDRNVMLSERTNMELDRGRQLDEAAVL